MPTAVRRSLRIIVRGVVQGVGFRPFVYRLAHLLDLKGTVQNTPEGVVIEIAGEIAAVEAFCSRLYSEAPPAARIDSIEVADGASDSAWTDFTILSSSESGEHHAVIPPDQPMCSECLAEMRDPANRRYGYPFINCTQCGPRYTILHALPYDRPATSMRSFTMCLQCQAEYDDPSSRRFHAQPNSCPECGPTLSFGGWSGEQALEESAKFIRDGGILACKGVGGFHLLCDATSPEAVQQLRQRKRRLFKPLAVLFSDLAQIESWCEVDDEEKKALTRVERPIVLLRKRVVMQNDEVLAPGIARLGCFLAYSPIHVLLLEKVGRPVVATSANLSEEPIITDSQELGERLSGVMDGVLDYDREIVHPCDDSVVVVAAGAGRFIRKARGFAPDSVPLPFAFSEPVLALGARMKSVVAIAHGNRAVFSPHIGDLGTLATERRFESTIQILESLHALKPAVVVCDLHPGYESTRWAKQSGLKVIQVQHHHAHILSAMTEHHLDGPVLGIAWDGTGLGDDSAIWGGEFLVCQGAEYERVGHLGYFPLLGGEKAITDPRRLAAALLMVAGENRPESLVVSDAEWQTWSVMQEKGIGTILTSSVGRLFDAVAALLGLVNARSFDGEAGMKLESRYDPIVKDAYELTIHAGIVDTTALFTQMVQDRERAKIPSRFMNTLAAWIEREALRHQLPVALSGGVFQNATLLELVRERLSSQGIAHFFHQRIPAGDGGLALGQLAYAYHQLR